MVQQEVKKKTRVYGTVAILSAMVLVSLIYVFGGTTGFAPNGTPDSNPDLNLGTNIPVSPMKNFGSLDELKNYLNVNSATSNTFSGGPLDSKYIAENSRALGESNGAQTPSAVPASPTLSADSSYSMSTDSGHSTTNIQVSGVDEADTTKNDDNYIYTQSNDWNTGQNYVYIMKADPNDARVVAKIPLENNTYLAGMFLSKDSTRLVIIGSEYHMYALDIAVRGAEDAMPSILPYYNSEVQTFINIYNIADKVHPTLASNFTLSGSYFNSRMIGDYLYAVVSQSAYVYNGSVPLPRVYTATATAETSATSIYYADKANFTDAADNYFTFTSFYGLNVKDASQLTNMTVLMGGASLMYVSPTNMYVTYPTWTMDSGSITAIYRVSIDIGKLAFQAKGGVPGNVINQYSMDEYNRYLRLATTNWKNTTENAVYVLNMDMTTVGALNLKNSEVRETIHSARFMGNKAYIVTFEQKDPFFVLDMSNPTAPRVAGKLEIPGFSSYLHPYDETHIIGLGMENSSVKLSLFDVSNVNAPREVAKYIVQGDYSYSQAQYDPKAFLFDLAKQLLVIPVSVTKSGVISGSTDGSGSTAVPPVEPDIKASPTYTQGSYFEGAYVFRLTTSGFELRGRITHQNTTSTEQYYYGDYYLNINRVIYIGNTLYTVSNAKVKLNSLTSTPDLAPIAEVNLK